MAKTLQFERPILQHVIFTSADAGGPEGLPSSFGNVLSLVVHEDQAAEDLRPFVIFATFKGWSGRHVITCEIRDRDGLTLWRDSRTVRKSDGADRLAYSAHPVMNVAFPLAGNYVLWVEFDGEHIAERTFLVQFSNAEPH